MNLGSSKINELKEKLAVTDYFLEEEQICILCLNANGDDENCFDKKFEIK
jgi:hypothetical protein